MGLRVEVDVAAAQRLLGGIQKKLARGLQPYARELTAAVRGFMARRIESRGELGGSPWPMLSAATVRRHGARPLLGRGSLWASLTKENAAGGFAVLSPDNKILSVGSRLLRYTERGTRRMPARPVAPAYVPDHETRRWAALVADRFLDGIE